MAGMGVDGWHGCARIAGGPQERMPQLPVLVIPSLTGEFAAAPCRNFPARGGISAPGGKFWQRSAGSGAAGRNTASRGRP